ncbi:MAG: NADAR family protein [Succinivibrionaceae bacterium]|nr:NADAR family protein [Succinivibrionaceae bacterium]
MFYRICFSTDNHHKATVNRDPDQRKSAGADEDMQSLNKLLNWWSAAPYDHYHQWLSETHDILAKAGTTKDKLKIADQEVDAIFFHKLSGPHGYLGNWYPSPFELDGARYSSVEQYIMRQKCLRFGGYCLRRHHPFHK